MWSYSCTCNKDTDKNFGRQWLSVCRRWTITRVTQSSNSKTLCWCPVRLLEGCKQVNDSICFNWTYSLALQPWAGTSSCFDDADDHGHAARSLEAPQYRDQYRRKIVKVAMKKKRTIQFLSVAWTTHRLHTDKVRIRRKTVLKQINKPFLVMNRTKARLFVETACPFATHWIVKNRACYLLFK